MTAVRKTGPTIPAAITLPTPSAALAAEAERLGHRYGQVEEAWIDGRLATFADRPPPRDVRAEARTMLAALAAALDPVEPTTVRAWLRPLAPAVRNPPTAPEFEARAAAIALACSTVPRCAFTLTSQAEALRRFSYWPSAADVVELLDEHARPIRARHRAIERVVTVRPLAELAEAREADWRRRDGWQAIEAAGRR